MAVSGSCRAGFLRKYPRGGERFLQTFSGLNSLSQSLTALPAPSGREPLALPGTLHFSGELYRHAKGPISEGAVERMRDWGSSFQAPPVKIAFGALRRARQTRNKNNHSAEYVQSAAEHIFNRPSLPGFPLFWARRPNLREIFLSPCVNGGYFASNRACTARAASAILMVWKKATPRYNKERR